MPISDSSKPFEKKTERLDVRLSHDKKKAFSEACENQGDTPSNAVRRFINSYIRRSGRDDIVASIRGITRGKGLFLIGGLTVLLAAFIFIPRLLNAEPSYMSKAELFTHYDYDESGLLELGEISPNDDHLHRVLNIDGEAGISPNEFYAHGTMKWSYFNPDSNVVLEDSVSDTKNGIQRRRVTIVSSLPDGKIPEGAMIPTGNPDNPLMSLEEYVALDEPWEMPNIDVPREIRREAFNKLPPAQIMKNNYVIFDLRDTDKFQIDVLEHTSHATMSKSMNYQRSVEWVEGEDKPHFVMGTGHDWWKSMEE